MNHNISVILLGAGFSKRFKSNQLKQNIIIKNKSLLDHSRDFFAKYFDTSKIYLVVNNKVKIKNIRKNEKVLLGASSRLESLREAMRYIYNDNLQTTFTMIHDIARPVININDIKKLINSFKPNIDGSALGYPITNALKEVDKKNINYNLYRSDLWASFTPQIFKTNILYKSIINTNRSKSNVDDDIELLMINNFKCTIIKSSPDNIKATYIDDIKVIEKLL
ncbi:MAG: 2-C-methyl-D-erythritol 4-phosphate cytidylyltransferase [Gammaproteobacteria bacterium]|nr:2-C-methyl-D-erythritol 4-phosphate cytidylyltransferase [Gammaproteobacteria bacterium]MBL6819027.1 2-C-methyl-D-erythritol 4-phosphate cytidylyltransferase [Gammaproteobacteria bacterium]MBL6899137.1 2-C-methyl-D-erythritol 4-phosphate cytidylyltransferase [Gammaproteobacteria bacterium]